MFFQFQTAGQIRFGCGAVAQLGADSRRFGQRALLVTGRHAERWGPLCALLAENHIGFIIYNVVTEPDIAMIDQAVSVARDEACDMVVAVGGGSVIDAGKAVAAMLANDGDLMDYLEVVGRGRALTRVSRPCIAVPTTAGTGAEVTRNAVLSAVSHKVKVSLRSPFMMPRLALVDPELTVGLPPRLTASTGMDALTQLIEALVSSKANPLTDGICREGLRHAAGHLGRAFEDGQDLAARTAMSLASLCGGLALANAGLGAVHGFAGPLGGMLKAPHGMVCAALLPPVMAGNIAALRAQAPDSPSLSRYRELAGLLTGRPGARADEGVDWIRRLIDRMGLPGLADLGLKPALIPEAVAKAGLASSMQGNPIALSNRMLEEILKAAL